jgi:hypothetical protein
MPSASATADSAGSGRRRKRDSGAGDREEAGAAAYASSAAPPNNTSFPDEMSGDDDYDELVSSGNNTYGGRCVRGRACARRGARGREAPPGPRAGPDPTLSSPFSARGGLSPSSSRSRAPPTPPTPPPSQLVQGRRHRPPAGRGAARRLQELEAHQRRVPRGKANGHPVPAPLGKGERGRGRGFRAAPAHGGVVRAAGRALAGAAVGAAPHDPRAEDSRTSPRPSPVPRSKPLPHPHTSSHPLPSSHPSSPAPPSQVLRPGLVKGPWTAAEDQTILRCLAEGITKWSDIAERISGRIGKQCRERYFNHLDREFARGDQHACA